MCTPYLSDHSRRQRSTDRVEEPEIIMQSADVYFVKAENEYRHPTAPRRAPAAARRRHQHGWNPFARRRA
jgi:hypothetical protein